MKKYNPQHKLTPAAAKAAALHTAVFQRTVIVLEGPMGSGKTTIANLVAASAAAFTPAAVAWQVVDIHYLTGTPGIREIAKHPKLIICCHEFNEKKFHHWWKTVLADAEVFRWRIERLEVALNKPKSITFKNKYL